VWEWAKIQLLCSKCHFLPLHTPDDAFYCSTIQWTELTHAATQLFVWDCVHSEVVSVHTLCCLTCTSKIVNSVCVFVPNLTPLLLENSTLGWVVLTIQWLQSQTGFHGGYRKQGKRYLPWGIFFSGLTVLLSFKWNKTRLWTLTVYGLRKGLG